jgi:hypothetical protein
MHGIGHQAVGDIDGRMNSESPGHLAFRKTRHRAPVGGHGRRFWCTEFGLCRCERIACRESRSSKTQSGCRCTQRTRDHEQVSGSSPIAPECREVHGGTQRSHGGHRDDQPLPRRKVASYDWSTRNFRSLSHPISQVVDRKSMGNNDGQEQSVHLSAHGTQVRHGDHDGLPAHIGWTRDVQVDVHAFDHEIGGDDHGIRWQRDQCGVVPDAEIAVRQAGLTNRGEAAAQSLDDSKLIVIFPGCGRHIICSPVPVA